MEDLLILVNENDEEIGCNHKMEVHEKGLLHRAFSVFIFNEQGDLMLQKRAKSKYHSAGLWSNTCCGHPKHKENILSAVKKRLMEEMGVDCDLQKMFSFMYKTSFGNGLIENEIDHVYWGISNSNPIINLEEAEDWKMVSMENIKINMKSNPEYYTEWFKICFEKVKFFTEEKFASLKKH